MNQRQYFKISRSSSAAMASLSTHFKGTKTFLRTIRESSAEGF